MKDSTFFKIQNSVVFRVIIIAVISFISIYSASEYVKYENEKVPKEICKDLFKSEYEECINYLINYEGNAYKSFSINTTINKINELQDYTSFKNYLTNLDNNIITQEKIEEINNYIKNLDKNDKFYNRKEYLIENFLYDKKFNSDITIIKKVVYNKISELNLNDNDIKQLLTLKSVLSKYINFEDYKELMEIINDISYQKKISDLKILENSVLENNNLILEKYSSIEDRVYLIEQKIYKNEIEMALKIAKEKLGKDYNFEGLIFNSYGKMKEYGEYVFFKKEGMYGLIEVNLTKKEVDFIY